MELRKELFYFCHNLWQFLTFTFRPNLWQFCIRLRIKEYHFFIYQRLREEKPLISGKFVFRSWDNCSMMPSPHLLPLSTGLYHLLYSSIVSITPYLLYRCLNLTLADTLFQFAYPLFIFVVCLYQFTHGAILLLIAYKDKSFFSDNLPNRIFFCSPIEKTACQKCLILLTGSLYNRTM